MTIRSILVLLAMAIGGEALAQTPSPSSSPPAPPLSTSAITVQNTKAPTPPPRTAFTPPVLIDSRACSAEDLSRAQLGIGEADSVMLRVIVTEQGTVSASNVAVLKSSGSAEADAAAAQCVSRWTYRPAVQEGKPTAAPRAVTVKIVFDPSQYEPAFVALYLAAISCIRSYPVDQTVAIKNARTILDMYVKNGAVTDLVLSNSSGNETLDSRAKSCFEKFAPDRVKSIDGTKRQKFVVMW